MHAVVSVTLNVALENGVFKLRVTLGCPCFDLEWLYYVSVHVPP